MLFFSRFMKDELGATAVEYGLIAALIATAIIGAVASVGGVLQISFAPIGSNVGPKSM